MGIFICIFRIERDRDRENKVGWIEMWGKPWEEFKKGKLLR